MTGKVLILGGYGNFGGRIAQRLRETGVEVIIAGRNAEKAEVVIDVHADNFPSILEELKPAVLVNATGPFIEPDYRIAKACIHAGVQYVDIAGGREFVNHFITLNDYAKSKGIAAITGASMFPAVTVAAIQHFMPEFSRLVGVEAGVSSGLKTARGLMSMRSVLAGVGEESRPFPTGEKQRKRYGWQDRHRVYYPGLGARYMGHLDAPDLDIIPARYADVKELRTSVGIGSLPLHWGLWFMSLAGRIGLPLKLDKDAEEMMKISALFERFGDGGGGVHVFVRGADLQGKPLIKRLFLVSHNGAGPQIGAAPAVAMVRKLLNNQANAGAYSAAGVVSLEEILAELDGYPIERL
ncbi:MAG: hypothetical protein FJX23_04175 [Alphaproteobacteria bacterium]|nr:hypothetical protein [Alphaproteobacteria bacterium]